MKYVVTLVTDNDSYSVTYEFYAGGEAWEFIRGALFHSREPITVYVKLIKGNGEPYRISEEAE